MNRIKVRNSSEYEMLKTLILDNQDPGIGIDGKGNIVTKNTVYILDTNTEEDILDTNKNDSFNRFESFYLPENISDTWDTLKTNVIDRFFKRRNYLVYNPVYQKLTEEEYRNIIIKYLTKYIPTLNISNIDIKECNEDFESIVYEVAVKFPFRFKGNPIFVINKFYFDENYKMLSSNASKGISKLLDDSKINKTDKNDFNVNPINQDMVNTFNEQIYDVMNKGFIDYLTSDALNTFNEYMKKDFIETDKDVHIECGAPRFRYVATLKVFNKKFYISNKITSDLLFEVSIDSQSNATFKCLQCGKENLLAGGIINSYTKNDYNEKIVTPKEVSFDDMSLDISDQLNDLSYHCLNSLSSCKDCYRIICSNNVSRCASCNEYICEDCNNPGHIITNIDADNNTYHLSCTTFDSVKYKIVGKDKIKGCALCKKQFSSDDKEERLCSLCKPIVEFDTLSKDKQEKYINLFTYHKNLFGPLSKKSINICNENLSSILFRVNNKYLFLDKSKIDLEKDMIEFQTLSYKK